MIIVMFMMISSFTCYIVILSFRSLMQYSHRMMGTHHIIIIILGEEERERERE